MREAAILLFLAIALGGSLAACTAGTTKRLLWGMLASSFGLGLAIEIALEGYLGILAISVFIVSDVILYLFFRTQALVPELAPEKSRADLVYRVSMLWLVLCSTVAAGFWIFSSNSASFTASTPAARMSALHEKVWSHDWILVAALLFSIAILSTGGFFLVRKEAE